MALKTLLTSKKSAILKRWFDLILDTYPADSSNTYRRDLDRFTNPVAYTISKEIGTLYDELLHDMDSDKLHASLDNIIRIRAVQDFPPSQAISFVLCLKKAAREELKTEIRESNLFKDYLKFESNIDDLAFLAFDIHMTCREKIHEIKVNEIKAERGMLIQLLERTSGTQ